MKTVQSLLSIASVLTIGFGTFTPTAEAYGFGYGCGFCGYTNAAPAVYTSSISGGISAFGSGPNGLAMVGFRAYTSTPFGMATSHGNSVSTGPNATASLGFNLNTSTVVNAPSSFYRFGSFGRGW